LPLYCARLTTAPPSFLALTPCTAMSRRSAGRPLTGDLLQWKAPELAAT
jgi:hypothetical protein